MMQSSRLCCRLLQTVVLLTGLIIGASGVIEQRAIAQSTQEQGEQTGEQDRERVMWPIQLGQRVLQVDSAFPVVDKVVLVPDFDTYLHELARWSPAGRWPILFEDDDSTARFIRSFKPDAILRRSAIAIDQPFEQKSVEEQRRTIEVIAAHAFAGSGPQSMREAFTARNFTPPGVVVTSTDDPACAAAITLAAGRGQLLAWLDDNWRRSNATLDAEQTEQLNNSIRAIMRTTGYPWEKLGDAIETITICKTIATKGSIPNEREPRAMTDLIGRHADQSRYAFAANIFGDHGRSAYTAMSSLFLTRDHFTLLNTYGNDGGWGAYGMSDADAMLAEAQATVVRHEADATTQSGWALRLPTGLHTDVVLVNSRGRPDDFRLSDNHPATAADIPILNTPAVVHMIHSWSMSAPDTVGTIGHTWFERGAYAVIGSVHEPQLSAFVPPKILALRWLNLTPYLVGARHWDGQGARPWKINTFGDPLMLCRPLPQKPRLPSDPAMDAAGTIDLKAHAMELMRAARDSKDARECEAAMQALILIGRDDVAGPFWRWADENDCGSFAAAPALGPLFRSADVETFLEAYDVCGRRDEQASTMLWHLLEPRLTTRMPERELFMLQSSIRGPRVDRDLAVLLPILRSAIGDGYAEGVLTRAINGADRDFVRKRLERLKRSR